MTKDILSEAEILLASKEYAKALAIFQECRNAGRGFTRIVATAREIECLTGLGQKKAAAKLLDELEQSFEVSEDAAENMRYLDLVAECNFKLGRYETAYNHLKEYAELETRAYTDQISKKLQEINENFEMEKRKYESMNIIDMASRLASIGVIVGSITHEINQPLSAINVNADSVLYWNKQNSGYLPEKILDAAKVISQAAKTIAGMITHMRQYWTSVETEPLHGIELNQSLSQSLTLLNSQISTHLISLKTELSEEELFVECNQVHLEQIVINLVVYLLQQTEGCTDSVRTLEVLSYAEGKQAMIEINCSWSDFNDRNELTDNDYSTMNWGKNLWLGLVIVRQALDSFRGSIVHYVNDKQWECFKIGFPLFSKQGTNESET